MRQRSSKISLAACLLPLALACSGPVAEEGASEPAPTDPTAAVAPVDLIEAALAKLAAGPRAFTVTELVDGEVVRDGRLLVAAAGGGEKRYLLTWNTEPAARVATDGEDAFASRPDGDVLTSPLTRAGTILLRKAAGSLLPVALDPSSFARYPLEALPPAGDGLRSLTAPLPGGGGWTLSLGPDDLPRRVALRSGGDAAETAIELAPLEAEIPADRAAFRLTPAAGGELVDFYAGPAPGDAAPEVSFQLADGGAVSLADLRGSAVVLDFWATWCVPCRPAMRELEELWQELGGEGLRVFGLRLYDSGDPTAYLEDLGISYPIGDGAAVEKPLAIDQYGLPSLYVIGRDGRVVELLVGYDPELTPVALRRAVSRALG